MKRTILLALLLTCGAAWASEWVSVGQPGDKTSENFVDVSSIRRSGDIARAWIKLVLLPHTQRGAGTDSGKWIEKLVQREAYNCSEGSAKMEAIRTDYEDGTSWQDSPESMARQTWEPVPPDTVGEAIMKFVCSWKPK